MKSTPDTESQNKMNIDFERIPNNSLGKSVRNLFEDKIYPEPNTGCWLWGGAISGTLDYGQVTIYNNQYIASRVSYLLYNGVEPGNFLVCHSCDNPACVNPDHLFLGTHKDNMVDCSIKKRFNPTFGENRKEAKLTENNVLEIRRLAIERVPQRKIARDFGVSQGTILKIIKRKRWTHI